VDILRHCKKSAWSGATSKQAYGEVRTANEKVAKFVAYPTGPNIRLEQRLITSLLEVAAVRTGERAILDELGRRGRIAHSESTFRRNCDDLCPIALHYR